MDDATRDLSADDAAAAIGRLTSELEWMTRDRDRLRTDLAAVSTTSRHVMFHLTEWAQAGDDPRHRPRSTMFRRLADLLRDNLKAAGNPDIPAGPVDPVG
jgi:hypothetical protein